MCPVFSNHTLDTSAVCHSNKLGISDFIWKSWKKWTLTTYLEALFIVYPNFSHASVSMANFEHTWEIWKSILFIPDKKSTKNVLLFLCLINKYRVINNHNILFSYHFLMSRKIGLFNQRKFVFSEFLLNFY